MDINQTLKKVGLDEKQAAVYAVALALGEAGMTELAKKAALKRPTVYLIVDELIIMGLLSETRKGKRKVYSAVHPRRLQEITRSREKQIGDVLPELVALYNTPKNKPKIQMFEGEEAIKQLYAEFLNSIETNKEVADFVNLQAFKDSFPELYNDFVKVYSELKSAKIRELYYDSEAAKIWVKEKKELKITRCKTRILPFQYEMGATDFFIFENKVLLFVFSEDFLVISIESKDIAKSFKGLFEAAWRTGQDV